LWLVFSWLHDRMTHSPILFVTSPEKNSGKTTLLGVLNFLACRGLQSVSISGPALFRSITKWSPTLAVDEADSAFVKNDDLRDVINAGWTRGQGIPRCHPETHEPMVFSAFAPKIVAMKGRNIPDTTLSRSIVITMKPRRASNPKEHTADFDHLDNETFARRRSQLLRWAADNIDAIVKATPEMLPGFHNRRRANWKPLLAIAEACGSESKTAAWAAARAIEKTATTFDASISVQLLRAIKGMFKARNNEQIGSEALVAELAMDKTAPWATYNKGKPISERQVAGLLKDYDIRPGHIRIGETQVRGYQESQFTDAFERYLVTEESENAAGTDRYPSQCPKPHEMGTSATFYPSQAESVGTDKNGKKPNNDGPWDTGTDAKGGKGARALSLGAESTPLDYLGPIVEVPDLGPDPLDEHGAPRPGTVASVPFMITAAMKAELLTLGFSADQIRQLVPQEAHDILAAATSHAKDADVGPPQPELCPKCGNEGGNITSYAGVGARVHKHCEQEWRAIIDNEMAQRGVWLA
jgi:hypothetical protein